MSEKVSTPNSVRAGGELTTLAIALCVYKSPSFVKEEHTMVGLFFRAGGHGTAYFEIDEEDAERFVVGQNYQLYGGQP